jgi:hypothetical protein
MEFIVKVELGKCYASQTDYSVVAGSMNGDFSNLTEHMHIGSEIGKLRIFYSDGIHRYPFGQTILGSHASLTSGPV